MSGGGGEYTGVAPWQTYWPILERAGLGEEALHMYAYKQRGNRLKGLYVSFWFAKVMGAAAESGAVHEDMVRHRVDFRGQTLVWTLAACEAKGQ